MSIYYDGFYAAATDSAAFSSDLTEANALC